MRPRGEINATRGICWRSTAVLLVSVSLWQLSGCSWVAEQDVDGAPAKSVDAASVPDAVPRVEPRSRYGNPKSYVVFGKRYYPMGSAQGYVERGIASWYGKKFHGRRTSNGDIYDMYAMTAAHKTLPLPTYVQVTNLENGRRIVVRVNDRGPFHRNRIIDLSYVAAKKIGIVARGTGLVEVRAVGPDSPMLAAQPSPAARTNGVPRLPSLYLQVGAFSVRANAEQLKAQLHSIAGETVRVSETHLGTRKLFRVRLGPLVGVEHADRLADILADAGVQDLQVVLD